MNGLENQSNTNLASEELHEIETYYNQHFERAKEYYATNASFDEVSGDVQQLDEMIAELKIELADVPDEKKEEVINSIIENYRFKIRLLEQVLRRQIKEVNHEIFEI